MKAKVSVGTAVVGLAWLGSSSLAFAQEAGQPAAGKAADEQAGSSYERSLDEIVVTAQKRGVAERAQDVPVALNAFSKAALEAAHVKDLTDIANLAPNVRLGPSGSIKGYGTFFIRGVGVAGSIPSNDPAVGTFINGMPLGISTGSLTELFDLASVEVLRGPQGTLFGRNVTGGAILLNTARPNGDLHAALKGGAGSDGQWEIQGSIEDGSEDRAVSGKLAFLYKHNDGFFHDLQSGGRVGRSNTYIVRPTVVLKPADNLTIDVMGEIGRDYGDGSVSQNQFNPATLVTRSGFVPPAGKFDVRLNTHGDSDLHWKHLVANANWNVGPGTITSVTGLRKVTHAHTLDTDGSSIDALQFPTTVNQHQFFQELRFAGKPFGTDAISITAGANYFDQAYRYSERRTFQAINLFQALRGRIDHKMFGAFAQTDVSVSDTITLTGGLRYTIERKSAAIASLGKCTYDLSSCTIDFTGKKTWRNLGPKLGAQWKLNRDVMFYGSWTRGFRSGGYNLRNSPPAVPGPYNEETVDSYEIGLKSEFFDRHLRFNLAGFLAKAKGLQEVVAINANQVILNAASSTTKGVEADITLIPAPGLVLTGSAGYVDAKYDSFDNLDLTGDGRADPALAVLLKLPQVPKWTYSAAANYEFEVGKLGTLSLRAAWSHVDARFADVINGVPLKAYDVIDASASLAVNDQVSIGLYGKNLTNKLYSNFGGLTTLFDYRFPSPPRTWMAEISFKY